MAYPLHAPSSTPVTAPGCCSGASSLPQGFLLKVGLVVRSDRGSPGNSNGGGWLHSDRLLGRTRVLIQQPQEAHSRNARQDFEAKPLVQEGVEGSRFVVQRGQVARQPPAWRLAWSSAWAWEAGKPHLQGRPGSRRLALLGQVGLGADRKP